MNQYEIDYQQGYDTANEEWLDRIKQVREEINRYLPKFPSPKWANTILVDIKDVHRILDKLIAESED